MDTNYISPYVNKGKSLTAQSRFDDAIAELQAGLALDTNRAAIYFNLGWVYDEKGLLAEALTNTPQHSSSTLTTNRPSWVAV